MSAAKPEGSGGGLEDADLDSLFMEEPLQRPGPAAPIDYKKRQSGEREDPQDPKAEEQTWPRADLEPEEPAPDLSEEPWPSPIEDAPEDSPIEAMAEPDPGGEVDLDPQHDRRHAVQDLGKATANEVSRGVIPYLVIMALFLILISLVPGLTTWLPAALMK